MKSRSAFPLMLILALAMPSAAMAQAQPVRVERDSECRWNGGDRESYCEVREFVLEPRSRLMVDSHQNGGIRVAGWDRNEISLVARVQAWSRDEDDARELAERVRIRTDGRVEPDGPRFNGRGESWAVTFELMVPRDMSLELRARNGGISLVDVHGTIDARTTNGGFTIVGGSGDIRGETTNGGVRVELMGRSWAGRGLDLETTNGGVRVLVPEGYNAELETGTVNGGLDLDIPIVLSGRITRTIRTTLGDGGPLIRARTTNGGVVIRRP